MCCWHFLRCCLAIVIVTILGPGIENALLAIGIVSIPSYARVTRSAVLSTKQMEFVEASRSLGGGLDVSSIRAHHAQLTNPIDRYRHTGHRYRHSGRCGAFLSWAGCATADTGMGHDA